MRNLGLKGRLLILFWAPVLIAFSVVLYYAYVKLTFPVASEITLPQEHRQFVETFRRYEEFKNTLKKEEIDLATLTQNPFYSQVASNKTQASVSPFVLKVSSIVTMGRSRFCIINERSYKEGDKIEKLKIVKIGDYYVELKTPQGKKIRLEVGHTYSYSN